MYTSCRCMISTKACTWHGYSIEATSGFFQLSSKSPGLIGYLACHYELPSHKRYETSRFITRRYLKVPHVQQTANIDFHLPETDKRN